MDFRLREDTVSWFKNIDGSEPLKSKFDLYYFCLVAGFASGRKSEPMTAGRKAPEFISYFIDDFKPAQKILIGLLIISELNAQGIDIAEKHDVRKMIQSLVNPNSQTNLSDEGMRLMNMYASGGYDYLTESTGDMPYNSDTFLILFTHLVEAGISESSIWS